MKRLRVGVLGCANIADRMVIPAINASAFFDLKFVCSRTEEKAREFAIRHSCNYLVGYDNLVSCDSVDVIYIPLPTGLHLNWALKALEAGKHLLIEKSISCSIDETKLIVDCARQRNLLVLENFMFEFHSQVAFIKNVINSGKLGVLRTVRSSFGFPPFQNTDNIRYQKELGGGALLDVGAYTIKVAQIFVDSNLSVTGSCLMSKSNTNVDLFGGAFLYNDHGVLIETTFGFDQFYQCNLELLGTEGKLIAERIFTAGPDVSPTIIIETNSKKEQIQIKPDNHFANILTYFYRTIEKGKFDFDYAKIINQSRILSEVKSKAQHIILQ